MQLALTEEEIDAILEQFIQRYFQQIRPDLSGAVVLALDKLRGFLREHSADDFAGGDDFAQQLLDEMEHSFGTGWAGRAATKIKRTTRDIYEFYRLRDLTVFGDGESPVALKLGGADRTSIDFIGRLDHFYFSKFADNTREPMRKFFVQAYFENGAALFGRETSDEIAAFRKASGDRFKNLTDRQVLTVVQTAVQRTRNWAHIGSLHQAGIEIARLVATLDARTTPLCEFLNGKLVRVGGAQTAIERLNKLEPAEFALELYGSPVGKELSKNPVDTMKQFIEADGVTIDEQLTALGRGIPPFHPNCRTRMEGVIEGVDSED